MHIIAKELTFSKCTSCGNYVVSKMIKSLNNVPARPSLVKGERWVRSAEAPVGNLSDVTANINISTRRGTAATWKKGQLEANE